MTLSSNPPRVVWPGVPVPLPQGEVYVRHLPVDAAATAPTRAPAPTAVLVHGLGGSSLNWYELVRELGDEIDAYALDLPGFGMAPPAPRHSLDVHARAVIDYLEARHSGTPVHLVGNSMGGLVCVLVAARRPDLIASLLLISPAMPRLVGLPREARLLGILALPRLGERLVARDLATPPEAAVRRLSEVLFGEPERIAPEWLELAAEERRFRATTPHAAPAFLGSLRSIVGAFARPRRLSAWREARHLSMPVTVVYGGRDKLVPSAADLWRSAVPHVRVFHLPTSGHVAMMERPHLVAEIVREHLAQLD